MISPTNKMFYESRYESSFTASVISSEKADGAGDGKYDIVLDRTCFYPEGGGQVSDTGKIEGFAVESVFEKSDDGGAAIVCHRIAAGDGAAPEKGRTVKCEVNFERRFQNMQDHTGQHILSESFIRTADLHTVSMHMGAEYMTIDLGVADPPKNFKLEKSVLDAAEKMANEIVFEDREVKTFYIPKGELSMYSLRKTPDLKDEKVRIVDIFKFDTSLCCGTHVSRTGEVGLIKIIGQEKVSQGVRVKFVCGGRALEDYAAKHSILSEIAESLSVKNTELKKAFEKMTDEIKSLSKAKADLFEKYYSGLSENASMESSPVYFDAPEGLSFQEVTRAGQIFSKSSKKFAFVLVKTEESGSGKVFRFVMGRTASCQCDVKAAFAEMSSKYSVKGGGSPQVVQGGNIPAGRLDEFREYVTKKLQNS